MTSRKLIRPEASETRAGRGVRRKQAPPEQTNAEEFYYLKQMSGKTPMVVVLNDGEELQGWIEWYDKGAIKLNRNNGPNLLVPKHSIRYMFKEEELKRFKKRAARTAAAASSKTAKTAKKDTEAADES